VKHDPTMHHRRSIRLPGYGYSQAGAYFVTFVTQQRLCMFGDVAHGEMSLNAAGEMAVTSWLDLPNRFPFVDLTNSSSCPTTCTESSSCTAPAHATIFVIARAITRIAPTMRIVVGANLVFAPIFAPVFSPARCVTRPVHTPPAPAARMRVSRA